MGAFSPTSFSSLSFSVGQTSPNSVTIASSPRRREVSQRIVLDDGTAITVRVTDGILIDDLLVSGMKAEGYRVMTNIDTFPTTDRKIKDYLIKTGVIQE